MRHRNPHTKPLCSNLSQKAPLLKLWARQVWAADLFLYRKGFYYIRNPWWAGLTLFPELTSLLLTSQLPEKAPVWPAVCNLRSRSVPAQAWDTGGNGDLAQRPSPGKKRGGDGGWVSFSVVQKYSPSKSLWEEQIWETLGQKKLTFGTAGLLRTFKEFPGIVPF